MSNAVVITQTCVALIFLTIIGLHIVKKNLSEAALYSWQSLAIVALIIVPHWNNLTPDLLAIALLTLVVKAYLAPKFLRRMVRKYGFKFTASTYANTPVTLVVIVGILLLVTSNIFAPLAALAVDNRLSLSLALAAMLSSLFLVVNRKGAFSEVIGILSLENSIVAFGILAGLEQSAVLQLGIIFDVAIWVIIVVFLVPLLYKHIGSLDVTNMKKLRD
jgi:hydrogenase-4 membrane subunit HyfE